MKYGVMVEAAAAVKKARRLSFVMTRFLIIVV